MLLLRSFLYGTLVIFTVWACSIILGPILIKKAVDLYFDDQVLLNGVAVSPKLSVSIDKIEFNFRDKASEMSIIGVSRGIDLGWTLSGGKPKMIVTTGLTDVEKIGRYNSLDVTMAYQALFSLDKASISAIFSELNLRDQLRIEDVEVNTYWALDVNLLTDLRISAKQLGSVAGDILAIPEINVTANRLSLSKPITEQDNTISVAAESVRSGLGNPKDILFTDVKLNIKNDHGTLPFDIRSEHIELGANDGKISGANVEGVYNLNSMDFVSPPIVAAKKFHIDEVTALVNVVTVPQKTVSGFRLETKALIENLILNAMDQHIGQITDATLRNNTSIHLEKENQIIDSVTTIYAAKDIQWTANINFIADVHGAGLMDCFINKFDCILTIPKLGLSLDIAEENFDILSKCLSSPCHLGKFTGEMRTTDTVKILGALNSTNIFNPLMLTILYSQLISGEKSGDGHSLEF